MVFVLGTYTNFRRNKYYQLSTWTGSRFMIADIWLSY
jgi:hypothetical protein